MTVRMKNIDLALIYDLWEEYAAAVNEGDLERWMALWIEESIQMPPDAPTRVGKEAIRRQMRPYFDRSHTGKMAIQTEEIRILGDIAYTHGTYEWELTPKDGGQTQRYSVKFLDILAKQVDGSWKIAIDCHNYNSPSP